MGNETSTPVSYAVQVCAFGSGGDGKVIAAPGTDAALAEHVQTVYHRLQQALILRGDEFWRKLATGIGGLRVLVRAPEAPTVAAAAEVKWEDLEVLAYALVEEIRAPIQPGRCSSATAKAVLVREFETLSQHRDKGHGRALLASVRDELKDAVAFWPCAPTADGLEFARNKLMLPSSMAAWFLLHCKNAPAAQVAAAAATDQGAAGVPSTAEAGSAPAGSAAPGSGSESAGTAASFPFDWRTDETPSECIKRIMETFSSAAAAGNWDMRALIQEYAGWLAGPECCAAAAAEAGASTIASDSSSSSSSSFAGPAVDVMPPSAPSTITGLGFQADHATAVAMLTVNTIFNTDNDGDGDGDEAAGDDDGGASEAGTGTDAGAGSVIGQEEITGNVNIEDQDNEEAAPVAGSKRAAPTSAAQAVDAEQDTKRSRGENGDAGGTEAAAAPTA